MAYTYNSSLLFQTGRCDRLQPAQTSQLTLSSFLVAPQIQDSVPLTNPGVSHLRIRGDGKIVAAAGWDGSVRIFGWKKMKPLAVLQHHKDLVHSVAFSDHPEPSRRLMAAGSKDQRISLWSIYTES